MKFGAYVTYDMASFLTKIRKKMFSRFLIIKKLKFLHLQHLENLPKKCGFIISQEVLEIIH